MVTKNNNKTLDKSKEKYPRVSEVISAFDKQRVIAGDHSEHLKSSGADNQNTFDRPKISHWQRENEYLTTVCLYSLKIIIDLLNKIHQTLPQNQICQQTIVCMGH